MTEAYSRPIAHLDVGLLDRCVKLASTTEGIVRTLPAGGRYLDWAGGYGVLTRLLRDRGFDFRHNDAYTANIFAVGLEADPEEGWDVITLFEVLEHLPNPAAELGRLANFAPILLFSTLLLPDPAPQPGSWWYYAPETGQHVSFYSTAALGALASRLGMELISDGHALHAFCRAGALPRTAAMIIRSPRAARWLTPLLRRVRPTVSLTDHDFRRAQELFRKNGPAA